MKLLISTHWVSHLIKEVCIEASYIIRFIKALLKYKSVANLLVGYLIIAYAK